MSLFWRAISRVGLVAIGVLAGVQIALHIGGVQAGTRAATNWLVEHLGWTGVVLVPLGLWIFVLSAYIVSGADRYGPRREAILWQLDICQEFGPVTGLMGTVFYLGEAIDRFGEDTVLLMGSVAPALYSTMGGLVVAAAAFLLRKVATWPSARAGPPPAAVADIDEQNQLRRAT